MDRSRKTLKLTWVSSGLMETARVRTSTSHGFRSGILTSWRTSRTSGPPNRGKTTALQVVAMLLSPRFPARGRTLASAADLPETQSRLHNVISSIRRVFDACKTLIPDEIRISNFHYEDEDEDEGEEGNRRRSGRGEVGYWKKTGVFWKRRCVCFPSTDDRWTPRTLVANCGTAMAFTWKIRVQCTWHGNFR